MFGQKKEVWLKTARLGRFTAILAIAAICLVCAGMENVSALTSEKTTRYYQLDTGVTFLWCNSAGVWQNGFIYGDTKTQHKMSYKWNLPSSAQIVSSGKYDPEAEKGQRGYFPFKDTDADEVALWAEPLYGRNKADYDREYASHAAEMKVIGEDGDNPVKYNMSFPRRAYDIKRMLEEGEKEKLYELLGNPSQDIIDKMNLLDRSSETYNPNVKGYMYFTPTVIEYTLTETIELGDLTAGLAMPSSARPGENYVVADASVLSPEIYAESAVLEKSSDVMADWKYVTEWQGSSDKKGRNTEGSIEESESQPGTVYYRITVTANDGQQDSAVKAIDIVQSVDEAEAILKLPEVTYVGHPVEARDQSQFIVEGKHYSAKEMYKAGLADNDMKTSADDCSAGWEKGSFHTVRNYIFNKAGVYTVTLYVDVNGKILTDTKEITVLDCPKIIESLSGKQKQNRKQVLDIKVVTHPDVPLEKLWIELETEKGTQKVHLEDDIRNAGANLHVPALNNSDLIKTRAIIKCDSDRYFTNVQLLFLTKNTDTQNFRYRIYAEDANGKSDVTERVFEVAPDMSPAAEIYTEETQLRNQGGNIAHITVEDRSRADSGDSLSRVWHYKECVDGDDGDWIELNDSQDIIDASFGKLKTIIHKHEGVGKLTYRIKVTDIWTDETLSEYITSEDYMSDSAEISTDIINVAPAVSLDLKESIKANIAMIAGSKTDKEVMEDIRNDFQAALVEEGVAANVEIDSMSSNIAADDSTEIGRAKKVAVVNIDGLNMKTAETFFEKNSFCVDEDTLYCIKPSWDSGAFAHADNEADPVQPFELTAYSGNDGNLRWSMNLSDKELKITDIRDGRIVADGGGRYVFFVSSGKTAIIDKNDGTYLATAEIAVGDDTYSGGHLIYTLKDDGVYSISTITGKISKVYTGKILTKSEKYDSMKTLSQGSLGCSGYSIRLSGTVNFVARNGAGSIVRCYLNTTTGEFAENDLSGSFNSYAEYVCMGFDVDGKVCIAEARRKIDSDSCSYGAVSVYDVTNDRIFTKNFGDDSSTVEYTIFPIKDENGRFTYIGRVYWKHSKGDKYYYSGIGFTDICSGHEISGQALRNQNKQPTGKDIVHAQQIGKTLAVQTMNEERGISTFKRDADYANAILWTADTDTGEIETSINGDGYNYMNFGSIAETGRASAELIACGFVVNGYSRTEFNGSASVKLSAFYNTLDNALNRTIARDIGQNYMGKEVGNILVLYDSENAGRAGDISLTAERIVKNRIKLIVVTDGELSGYQKDLHDRINEAGGTVYTVIRSTNFAKNLAGTVAASVGGMKKDAYKVTREAGKEKSSIKRTYKLDKDTTYYYEYYVKVSGTDNKLAASGGQDTGAESGRHDSVQLAVTHNITESVPESTRLSGGDFTGSRYYVTATELDDFETEMRNGFFAYKDASGAVYEPAVTGGECRLIDEFRSGTSSGLYENSAFVEFSIPEGNEAVLSFDFNIDHGDNTVGAGNSRYGYVKINGEPWSLFGKYSAQDHFMGSYTHPALLTAGDYSLEFCIQEKRGTKLNAKFAIDDIKVMYVSRTMPETVYIKDTSKDRGDGWTYHSGTLISPGAELAYDGQKARHISMTPQFKNGETVTWTDGISETKVMSAKNGIYYKYLVIDSGDKYVINSKICVDMRSSSKGGTDVLSWYSGDVTEMSNTEKSSNLKSQALLQAKTRDIGRIDSLKQFFTAPEIQTGAYSFERNGKYYAAGTFTGVELDLIDNVYAPCSEGSFFIKESENAGESEVFMLNKTYDGNATFCFSAADDEWYLSDFRVYTLKDGRKIYITEENMYDEQNMASWDTEGCMLTAAAVEAPEKEEDVPLFYKKGEQVVYDIFYSDYENDPSKASYWKYTHTPWNDGEHPKAAVIIDKYGAEHVGKGSVLSDKIDRFYIDGKYTVEHWQYDSTGNPKYDKQSNTAKISFYIMGDGEIPQEPDAPDVNTPPTVEILTTQPSEVNEGDVFRITAKVDDREKDELITVIEVYHDGKLIYTWRENHFIADPATGKYPVIVTDTMPEKAQPGKYSVICTAKDDSGIDIETYEFKVEHIEKYGIAGRVYHTETWEKNRREYNMQNFGTSTDARTEYGDYIKAAKPRMRGSNVFWNGERFMLSAEVKGAPMRVTVSIEGTEYMAALEDTGSKNAAGDPIFGGSLWDGRMNGRWGMRAPEELKFIFTAYYKDGQTALYEEAVIVDDTEKYIRMHRRF